MILLIDNYDSFTYNLVQYLGELGAETEVARNDQITTREIRELRPERIVISPGPCTPNEAGISVEVARELGAEIPILGVVTRNCILPAWVSYEIRFDGDDIVNNLTDCGDQITRVRFVDYWTCPGSGGPPRDFEIIYEEPLEPPIEIECGSCACFAPLSCTWPCLP